MLNRNRLNRSRGRDEDEWNPMDGIGNLVDAMLVLAVGIMLALVINWNVDITNNAHVDKTDSIEVTENEMQKAENEDIPENGENLKEMGKVYYDENTGRYYIVGGGE